MKHSFKQNVCRSVVGAAAINVGVALLSGCSQSAMRGRVVGPAPALNGDAQAHIRGVSDPNAQFTLAHRTEAAARTNTALEEVGGAAACAAADLQVYEAAASMNGEARVVRFALRNRSAVACRVSGYPVIELQNEDGAAIASVAVRQTGATSLSGTVVGPIEAPSATAPVEIVLRPGGQASFEIGWTGGEGCMPVSRFSVSLPSNLSAGAKSLARGGLFVIHRALSVCGGEMQVTALQSNGAAL